MPVLASSSPASAYLSSSDATPSRAGRVGRRRFGLGAAMSLIVVLPRPRQALHWRRRLGKARSGRCG